MRTRLAVLLALLAAAWTGLSPPASAHPLNTSAVLLDIGTHRVTATVELPLDQLSIARNRELTAQDVLADDTLSGLRTYVRGHLSATDATGQAWTTVVSGGRVARVQGAENLILRAVLTPASGAAGDFVLHDDVVVDTLISHRIFVSARYGHAGGYTVLAMLSWQTRSVPVTRLPSQSRGFVAAVHLGVQHISSGSDHLLFLLMLLLPAPLVARRKRWVRRHGPSWPDARATGWRVVHVVTAFAVGHSVTLALGALGWVHAPARLVESGIALSVLVSAVHAIRPLVRRGEVLIGVGFGLLHGLSFAVLLGGLQLSRGDLVTTLLGFNLGIELTQLLVVALVVPSLIVLSSTSLYPVLRISTAALGVAVSAGWLAQRLGALPTNPLEPIGNLLVDRPLTLAAALAAVALTAVARRAAPTHRTREAP